MTVKDTFYSDSEKSVFSRFTRRLISTSGIFDRNQCAALEKRGLLHYVSGAVDGERNYSLTQAGQEAAFLTMPEDEFCHRFKIEMTARGGEEFDDGTSIADYANQTAPTYFEEPSQRCEGPEECAKADMSYWGED